MSPYIPAPRWSGNSSNTRRWRIALLLLPFGLLLLYVAHRGGLGGISLAQYREQYLKLRPSNKPIPVTLVVASQSTDNTSWVNEFPDWTHALYETDNPAANYTVPLNKGKEAMVYLTYIIDHYDKVEGVIAFQHADRYQWHNDDPLYDGVRILRRLQLDYVKEQGYVNMRCTWVIGCPPDIRPFDDEKPSEDGGPPPLTLGGPRFKATFEELFPEIPVPSEIGASCCAQFAVSAEQIRKRPKSDYERYRRWLLSTDYPDDHSGRIMEFSWHIMFGREANFCTNAPECYCKVYGLCKLECQGEGGCRSQYNFPEWDGFPKDWPDYDENGQWRNITALREQQDLDYAPRRILSY